MSVPARVAKIGAKMKKTLLTDGYNRGAMVPIVPHMKNPKIREVKSRV